MDSTAKKLWDLAYEHGIWISESFIRGSDNSDADHASRILNDRTEWALPVPVFNKLCDKFFFPSIDLFASRLNAKTKKYISWIPDPFCWEVDAFTFSWNQLHDIYLFPPFSVLHRTLQKIRYDNVQRALVIFPIWMTQHWFPVLLKMLTSHIFLLPQNPPLFLPWQTISMPHPLGNTLLLGAATISGCQEKIWTFHQKL